MHQRSRVVRAALSGAIGLLLIAGCLPAPNRVTAASLSREGVVKQTLPKGSPVLVTAGQDSSAPSSPLPPPSILSNNGANILRGAVRAPASIISHNGGNIVSNNGGSIVSNNGGSIISHNGGNVISNNGSNLQIAQVPLAYTTVRLKDAAGNPVKDDQGKELVTKTDAEGNYSFPVDVKGRNLVIEADVDGQSGKLKSLLPKDGLQAGTGLDVDLTSTLTLAYILDQYVKGDLATFERLPKDIEAKARTVTETAIVQKGIELPSSLEGGAIVAKVDEVRRSDTAVDQIFEEIRKLLVIAGITKEGDGRPALEVNPGVIGGLIADPDGNIYVFSQSRHTLWKLNTTGILQTIVGSGQWGYKENFPSSYSPGHNSGLAWGLDGGLIVSDTYNNRIVEVGRNGVVKVLAGIGEAAYGGDGQRADGAQLNAPTGLIVNARGDILFSDSGNNVIRQILIDGTVQTVAGTGRAGFAGDGGKASLASLQQPEGLCQLANGDLYVADYGNKKIRKIDSSYTIKSESGQSVSFDSPIAVSLDNNGSVVFINHYNDGVYRYDGHQWGVLFHELLESAETDHISIAFPHCLLFVGQDCYLTTQDGVLVRVTPDGYASRVMGEWQGTVSPKGNQLVIASSIAVDKMENVYISDLFMKRIFEFMPSGTISAVAGDGVEGFISASENPATTRIGLPSAVQITNDGMLAFATTGAYPAIQRIQADGSLVTLAGNGKYDYEHVPIGPSLGVSLAAPDDFAFLPDGRMVFAESDFDRIMQVTTAGDIERLLGPDDIKSPHCLAVNKGGDLYFVERTKGRISILAMSGELRQLLDDAVLSPYFTAADIKGLAIADSGEVYVATKTAVIKVRLDHSIVRVAGQGGHFLNGSTRDNGLFEVSDIAMAPSGALYILEYTQAKRITKEQLAIL